jgi:hypothetical protein
MQFFSSWRHGVLAPWRNDFCPGAGTFDWAMQRATSADATDWCKIRFKAVHCRVQAQTTKHTKGA